MRIGGSLILGTPQERVRLLRAGVDGKLIEKLYIERNNFKIVCNHILFNQVDDINKIKTQDASLDSRIIKCPLRYTHHQRRLADWAVYI